MGGGGGGLLVTYWVLTIHSISKVSVSLTCPRLFGPVLDRRGHLRRYCVILFACLFVCVHLSVEPAHRERETERGRKRWDVCVCVATAQESTESTVYYYYYTLYPQVLYPIPRSFIHPCGVAGLHFHNYYFGTPKAESHEALHFSPLYLWPTDVSFDDVDTSHDS